MKKILIMAGGTGGHVFPALAVAEELVHQGVEIHWLGTNKGIENRIVPNAGYVLHVISVSGLVGTGWRKKMQAPFTLLRAVIQALKVIFTVKPSVVLGMGGFVSGPGGVAAYLSRKPIVIHEQNAVAGLTNHYLAKIATTVLAGFRNAKDLSEKAVWVGNPVRQEIVKSAQAVSGSSETQNEEPNRRKILVLGGSQGAKSLNEKLPDVLAQLQDKFLLEVWHQTGKARSVTVKQKYSALNRLTNVRVDEFIDDMASAYQWPDLIICRAGAMTVTEIMAAGKAAIFLPYPYAAGDHQTANANIMVEAGASLMTVDQDIESDKFSNDLTALLERPMVIQKMAEEASRMYRANAAKNTANYCLELLYA